MGRAEHLFHKCVSVYNARFFKFSKWWKLERGRQVWKYFLLISLLLLLSNKEDSLPCSVIVLLGLISYHTNVHAHCTIEHCFYNLNTEFLYFWMNWDSLYMFSILIYFVNLWITNKQNSLSEWMRKLKMPGCNYVDKRVNPEGCVINDVLRKCLERVCDFTYCVSWAVLCPRISDADKVKKSS